MTLKGLVNKNKMLCSFQVHIWGEKHINIQYERLYKVKLMGHLEKKTDLQLVGELRK